MTVEEIEESVDDARRFLRGGLDDATTVATALVELSSRCVVGIPCKRHSHAIHGQEAEELRAGVELILKNSADFEDEAADDVLRSVRKALIFLLDRIDARDSLSFLETTNQNQETSP